MINNNPYKKIIKSVCYGAIVASLIFVACQKSANELEQYATKTDQELLLAETPASDSTVGLFDDSLNLAPGYDPAVAGDSIVRLVLVIDDFGHQWDTPAVQGLLHLEIPVAIAIIPGTWAAKRTAKLASELGKEIILHLPMEPDHPEPNTEQTMLRIGMSPEEVGAFIDKSSMNVPGILGLNNHMGSAATRGRKLMSFVANECKIRNWWILDSITHPKSVLYDEAVRAGVPAITRDIFLDHENNPESVRKELYRAVGIARKWNRPVVLIGHPRKVTWEVLASEIPLLKEKGIQWVPLSKVLKKSINLASREE
ncbi:MAG: divergent polysaccharide deacetylase family protein [Candidatus Electryonea clarkiae]|nr:divergent polysaccharide deacetylase family protein [Candidatus Electryonea clarkiae]MDP8287281.1 divergent polysaccharide deacetylase family protein [Candidatus Electryonea clarkiae]